LALVSKVTCQLAVSVIIRPSLLTGMRVIQSKDLQPVY